MARASKLLFALLLIVLFGFVTDFDAEAATNGKALADTGKKPAPKIEPKVDQEIEAKALDLVRAHLPELKVVLSQLREKDPREYDRAIRDLVKSARKLELAKNRDEQLYDIEVELLKAQNQVNFLTAKLKVRDSKSDRKRLRESLERLQESQIARAHYDVNVYQERLNRAQAQLEAAKKRLSSKQNGNGSIEKLYTGLLRKAGRESKNSSTK
ncbi:MAG: hypothetical protein AB8B91_05120 [Rubripirellula sp.]